MIYKAISVIEKKLDEFIRNKFSLNEQAAIISNLTENEGIQDYMTNSKLLITLVNIEREYAMGVNFKTSNFDNGVSSLNRPPVHINFFILLSSNFINKNYDESLKYISASIEFIQRNDLINEYNTPEIDKKIVKLQLEIANLSIHELSNLWSILGGKYMPSILCKVRMLTVDTNEIDKIQISSETFHLNE